MCARSRAVFKKALLLVLLLNPPSGTSFIGPFVFSLVESVAHRYRPISYALT